MNISLDINYNEYGYKATAVATHLGVYASSYNENKGVAIKTAINRLYHILGKDHNTKTYKITKKCSIPSGMKIEILILLNIMM